MREKRTGEGGRGDGGNRKARPTIGRTCHFKSEQTVPGEGGKENWTWEGEGFNKGGKGGDLST